MSFVRNIDIELNPQSIDNAIREIERFERDLRECCNDLIRALTEEGITVAKMNVMSMNAVYTGYLEESIDGIFFPRERIGVIFTPAPYSIYVEYGTGIVGKNGPAYPGEMMPGYEPDAMGHGESGWWYFDTTDGNRRFKWTKGMESRPFMYNTLRWLEQNAPEWASAAFSGM